MALARPRLNRAMETLLTTLADQCRANVPSSVSCMRVYGALRTGLATEPPVAVKLVQALVWAHNPAICDTTTLAEWCAEGTEINEATQRLCFYLTGGTDRKPIAEAFHYIEAVDMWLRQIPVYKGLAQQCLSLSAWKLFWFQVADLHCINACDQVVLTDADKKYIHMNVGSDGVINRLSDSCIGENQTLFRCTDGVVTVLWAHTNLCVVVCRDTSVMLSVDGADAHDLTSSYVYSEPRNARVPPAMLALGRAIQTIVQHEHEEETVVISKMQHLRRPPLFADEKNSSTNISSSIKKLKTVPAISNRHLKESAEMGMVGLHIMRNAWKAVEESVRK